MTIPDDPKALEQAEAWLATVCTDGDGPDIDRIKRHVQIALNEQWLKSQIDDTFDGEIREAAKQRVRAMLGSNGSSQEITPLPAKDVSFRFPTTNTIRWATLIALASAACLFVMLRVDPAQTTEPSVLLVSAFEDFEKDDLGQSLDALNEDLEALETAWDQNDSSADSSALLDQWSDDLDSTLDETHDSLQWLESVMEGTTQ